MFTLTIHGKYGTFTETFTTLEGARLRAAALYGDLPVSITGTDGAEYRRFGLGSI